MADSRVHPVEQGSATRWLNDLELRAWRCYVETQSDLMDANPGVTWFKATKH